MSCQKCGPKWSASGYKNAKDVVEISCRLKEVIQILDSTNTTFHVNTKCTSILIDNCTQCKIILKENVVGNVELNKIKRSTIRVMKDANLFDIANSSSSHIWMTQENANRVKIFLTGSDSMNLNYMNSQDDEVEVALPEQILTIFGEELKPKHYPVVAGEEIIQEEKEKKEEKIEKQDRLNTTWEKMHGTRGDKKWLAPRQIEKCDQLARKGYATTKAHEYNDEPDVLLAKVKVLAEMLRESTKCIAYTGAGISTASGIRDYASKSKDSKAKTGIDKVKSNYDAKPTLAHRVMTELYRKKHLKYWIQQNHDGLPQKAGYPQHAINEVHGGWYDPSNPVISMSGLLRNDLFKSVLEWENKCDLCLVIGTSLSGMNADRLCATLGNKEKSGDSGVIGSVIVSIQETPLDHLCALRIFSNIDHLMMMLATELGMDENAIIPIAGIAPTTTTTTTTTTASSKPASPRKIAILGKDNLPSEFVDADEKVTKYLKTAHIHKLYYPSSVNPAHLNKNVFIVPYDENGALDPTGKAQMKLDLQIGSKVVITQGNYAGSFGDVTGQDSQGHYTFRFMVPIGGKQLPVYQRQQRPKQARTARLGLWWIEAAYTKTVPMLPIIPVTSGMVIPDDSTTKIVSSLEKNSNENEPVQFSLGEIIEVQRSNGIWNIGTITLVDVENSSYKCEYGEGNKKVKQVKFAQAHNFFRKRKTEINITTTTTTTTTSDSMPVPPPISEIKQVNKKKYVRQEKKEEVKVEKEPVEVRFDVYLHRQVIPSIVNFRLVATSLGDKKKLARTIVAFDLDRTLKYSSLKEKAPLEWGQTTALPLIKVRGGDNLITCLDHLKEHGATMMVLTARRPSPTKFQTVTQELSRLGLLKYFEDNIKPHWWNVGTESSPSKVYGGNGICICDYYKPHAFLSYIELRKLKPRRILFIDDFVANVTAFSDYLKEHADNDQLLALKSFEGIWMDPQCLIDEGVMGASNSENSYSSMFTAHRKKFKGVKQTEVDSVQIKNNEFHHKCRYNARIENIEEYLKDSDIDINGTDKYGRTPLAVVCKRGFTEVVELFLSKDADLDKQCDRGNTPVMYAAMGGHEKICDLLINAKADLTKTNKFHRRCDVVAMKQGHAELGQKLIDAGAYADC